jgi:uncharacterized protein YidB (DUF937 family)
MGLLDGLVGALGGALGGAQGGAGQAGGLGPLGALLGAGGSQGGNADLLRAVVAMLGNDAPNGGLAGMLQQFQRAGLGDQVASWVGTGPNMPVSANQIESAMGPDAIGELARQFGLGTSDTSDQLARMLPEVINHFTPNGQVPQGGLGSMGDLLGALMRR